MGYVVMLLTFTLIDMFQFANRNYTSAHAARGKLYANTLVYMLTHVYQDYQDPSVDSTVTDGHRQGKKA